MVDSERKEVTMKKLFALTILATALPVFAFQYSAADADTTYICTARNLVGKRYVAQGSDRVLTQESAMQECEATSFRCYPTGCKETKAPN